MKKYIITAMIFLVLFYLVSWQGGSFGLQSLANSLINMPGRTADPSMESPASPGSVEPSAKPANTPKAPETPEPTPVSKPVPSPKTTPVSTPAPSTKPVVTPKPTAPEQDPIVISDDFRKSSTFFEDKNERYIRYGSAHRELDIPTVLLHVNIGLDHPFYTDVRKIIETDAINVLVNKYHKLPDEYAPQLEELSPLLVASGKDRQFLRREAREAFEKMSGDAKKLGLNITAYSTYRSIQLQNDIWTRKVKSGRSIADVDKLNARGGHSEHNTGLAVDVIINDYQVEKTEEFKWYKDHAHLYGFILRYPKGKEAITGYQYEPWHLRFLGEELAVSVYESGLTYEEYYAMHIEPVLKGR